MARVLVVDDNPAVRASIGVVLEHGGFSAMVAGDGRAGLQVLESQEFDVLIVDVFMPEMDGFEFIRSVRQQKPNLPIIAISGASFGSHATAAPDFLSMATKLGAIRSLRKPFKPADLYDAINACLAQTAQDQAVHR